MKSSVTPFFSVIIPVYNAAEWLAETLASVAAQCFSDFEVILIDDGSTDDSCRIARTFCDGDARFRLVSRPNGGVSAARNLGLSLACGEWILFVDADDTLSPRLLSVCQETVFTRSDTDLVVFGFERVASDSVTPCSPPFLHTDKICDALVIQEQARCYGFLWNRIFKRSLIQQHKIGFDETIRYCEDHLFTFTYCRYVRSITLIPDLLYRYRILPGSLSSRWVPPHSVLYAAACEYRACMCIPGADTHKAFSDQIALTARYKFVTAVTMLRDDSTLSRSRKIVHFSSLCYSLPSRVPLLSGIAIWFRFRLTGRLK